MPFTPPLSCRRFDPFPHVLLRFSAWEGERSCDLRPPLFPRTPLRSRTSRRRVACLASTWSTNDGSLHTSGWDISRLRARRFLRSLQPHPIQSIRDRVDRRKTVGHGRGGEGRGPHRERSLGSGEAKGTWPSCYFCDEARFDARRTWKRREGEA